MYISLHLFVDIWESGKKKQEKNWEKLNVLKIVNDFIDSVPFRWFSFSFSDNYLSSLFLCGFFQEVSGITPQYDRLIIMVSFLCLTFHLWLILCLLNIYLVQDCTFGKPLLCQFGISFATVKNQSIEAYQELVSSVTYFLHGKALQEVLKLLTLFIISIHHLCDEGQGCWARVGSVYLCQEWAKESIRSVGVFKMIVGLEQPRIQSLQLKSKSYHNFFICGIENRLWMVCQQSLC